MGYPSNEAIFELARKLNVDAHEVFAYASVYGQLPPKPDDLGALQIAVRAVNWNKFHDERLWPFSKQWFFGATAWLGRVPTSYDEVEDFMVLYGVYDRTNRIWREGIPMDPTRYYPPDAAAPTTGGNTTQPPATGQPPVAFPILGEPDFFEKAMAWAKAHPAYALGIAGAGLWLLSSGGKVRF